MDDNALRKDPHATASPSYLAFLDRLAHAGSVFVGALGATVLLAWLWKGAFFYGAAAVLTMKFNAACGLVAAAAALWLLHTSAPGSRRFRLARGLAACVMALGVLTLAQDLFGLELGIDQALVRDPLPAPASGQEGRMAPGTAVSLATSGLALLALKARRERLAARAPWLAVPSLFIATLGIVGYAYGVSTLYGVPPYTSMPPHAALAFFVLAFSLLAADPGHGLARLSGSETAGGALARWLLPSIPFFLFLLGWVRLRGQLAGWYGTRVGLSLMVVSSSMVCVVIVAWVAVKLHRVDVTRKVAEMEVRGLNAELERRVQERTEELGRLSADLAVVNITLEQLTLQDALTGLANRRWFDRHLAAQVAVARRHARPLALVMCDVDYFKEYNDDHGHQAGDESLQKIARALKSCCRRPADMAARYGGEEFALILPDTDLAGAVLIGETARAAVAQLRIPNAMAPTGAFVSISGGIAALLIAGDMSPEQLIAAADEALYEAKRLGRNRIVSLQAERALGCAAAEPTAGRSPGVDRSDAA